MGTGKALTAAFFFTFTATGQAEVRSVETYPAVLEDLNQVLNEARAVPHFENGQAAGYVTTPASAGGIYDQLRLESVDTVSDSNGEPLPTGK